MPLYSICRRRSITRKGARHSSPLMCQRRTISLCQYANGDFAWGELDLAAKYFHRQPEDVRERFLGYELMVYFCEGTQSEKIDWFKVINIAGLKLTAQEMRNAVYSGPWVADAKRYFRSRDALRRRSPRTRFNLGCAPGARGISSTRRWKVTTSSHGRREARPCRRTSRCCAAGATDRRATSRAEDEIVELCNCGNVD